MKRGAVRKTLVVAFLSLLFVAYSSQAMASTITVSSGLALGEFWSWEGSNVSNQFELVSNGYDESISVSIGNRTIQGGGMPSGGDSKSLQLGSGNTPGSIQLSYGNAAAYATTVTNPYISVYIGNQKPSDGLEIARASINGMAYFTNMGPSLFGLGIPWSIGFGGSMSGDESGERFFASPGGGRSDFLVELPSMYVLPYEAPNIWVTITDVTSGDSFFSWNASAGADGAYFPYQISTGDTIEIDYSLYVSVGKEVSAVPEPSTVLLLGSGLIGLVGYGRKKFFKR